MEFIIGSQNTPPDAHGPQAMHVRDEITSINLHRIYRMVWILAVIHLAHVVIFWPYAPGASERTQIWRNGIIVSHATMMLVTVACGAAVFALQRRSRTSGTAPNLLSGLVSLFYLLFGATLAVIDQLVSPSITPLLVASTGVAVTILVHPAVAAINFALVLAFFTTAVAWTQPGAELLLSVRVNSITATGVGFGVSYLMWRNMVISLRQKQQIEEQTRELEEKNKELASLATQDVLTGLSNREKFMRMAMSEAARTQRTGLKACLILADIDQFKQVNDTYGHPVGDSVLKGVADILAGTLRDVDTVGRLGGEEFAILLPETALEEGVQVAERLRAAVEGYSLSVHGQSVRVTASFGVAALSVDHAEPLSQCYRAADMALYQAKRDGRNCIRSAE